jgi:Translation initiation factor eIF3 subunit 135
LEKWKDFGERYSSQDLTWFYLDKVNSIIPKNLGINLLLSNFSKNVNERRYRPEILNALSEKEAYDPDCLENMDDNDQY